MIYTDFRVVDVKGMGSRLIKKNVFITDSPIMSVRFDPEDTMVAAGKTAQRLSVNDNFILFD